ncbi:MAG: mechanosensitive ion channel [Bacteroidales bacterium]|nr:mechanosensitive ion channel [Bacteroidales bacterium]
MQTFFNDIREELFQYYDKLVVITPRLLLALLVLILAWFVSRKIRSISDRKLKRQMEDPLLADFLATMIRFVIILIGILFSLKIIGLGGVIAGILAGAGLTAFIIGFTLRDIGENFLAGIIMAFKRPFRIGDFVESGVIKGKVVTLNMRDTQLKTLDGKDVFVPNALILKTPLINYTIDGFLRYDFMVGLPDGSDYNKSIKMIEGAVNTVEGVIRRRRKTTANISGISPGCLDVTVSFWIDTFRVNDTPEKIRSEVFMAVQKVLEQQTKEFEK